MGKIRGHNREYKITINGTELDISASREVYRHSTDFSWGFLGSGPSQVALALMLHYTGSKSEALKLYTLFKFAFLQHLPMEEDFEMDEQFVTAWISEQRLKGDDA